MYNIIEKITKLMAVTEEAGATEAEAAQALMLAQRLMMKHGIDQTQVNRGPDVDWGNELSWGGQRWMRIVALAVGNIYGSVPVFWRHTGVVKFVGRDETCRAAEITYLAITRQIERLYRAGLPRGMSKGERARWRNEFKVACAGRVLYRVNEIIRERRTDEGANAIGCTALVVLSHEEQLRSEVDDFLKGEGTTKKGRGTSLSVKPSVAAMRGDKAGRQVSIQDEIK